MRDPQATERIATALNDPDPTVRGVAVRTWAQPEKLPLTGFGQEVAVEVLPRLEDYFGVPYAFGKLDQVGVPDFEAGAMEKPADVFWLRRDELEDMAASLDAGETQFGSLAEAVEQRKMLWRGQRRVTPPQLLPKKAWFKVLESLIRGSLERLYLLTGLTCKQNPKYASKGLVETETLDHFRAHFYKQLKSY